MAFVVTVLFGAVFAGAIIGTVVGVAIGALAIVGWGVIGAMRVLARAAS